MISALLHRRPPEGTACSGCHEQTRPCSWPSSRTTEVRTPDEVDILASEFIEDSEVEGILASEFDLRGEDGFSPSVSEFEKEAEAKRDPEAVNDALKDAIKSVGVKV